jgi:hypothetical protein
MNNEAARKALMCCFIFSLFERAISWLSFASGPAPGREANKKENPYAFKHLRT